MSILVVDDREENRYLLEMLLRGHGHEVRSVSNGAEALQALRGGQYEMIISDILMPVMDGFQLCREVRADEGLRAIPFVVYTATYTGPQDEAFAKEIGADCFIVKPCEPEVFLKAVRQVMAAPRPAEGDGAALPPSEEKVLKLYNERLVRKLEQKMEQLEKEVAARRVTEAALRKSEEKHRRLFETMPQGVVYLDREGRIFDANPAAERTLGLTVDQMLGRRIDDPRLKCVREDGSEFRAEERPVMAALRTGRPVENVVMGVHNARSKELRWLKTDAVPLFQPGEDRPYQVYAAFDDITDRKLAEEERAKLQAQFQQAQKMETVGRLAGGVAHDFNNLLSIILGYTELVVGQLAADDVAREGLEEVKKAGERAAALTKQLLVFSRKLALEPRVVNLNRVVGDLDRMLRRVIGEDIDFRLSLAPELWATKVDPGQLELAIMNLAVNARDAMPGGGKLLIATENRELRDDAEARRLSLAPGRYVVLAVSDNGCGMDEATRERIFEPFFTTKERGKGTGLGLSIVYGLVKQSGGGIEVSSEPRKGATFRLHLPRFDGDEERARTADKFQLAVGGSETVLIVEDEDGVRQVAQRMLSNLGYRVLTAASGAEALRTSAAHAGEIQLLLTDMVMPAMSGPQLAGRLQETRPALRVLYMSGYSESAVDDRRALEAGAGFIGKPFDLLELARRVRELLDRRPATSAGGAAGG